MNHTDVIISIHHEFAQRIYRGIKHFELRKHEPKINPGTRCWIYEPMPVGKITGYFYYRGCVIKNCENFWQTYHDECGIDLFRFTNYYRGHETVHAWMIGASHQIPPTDLSAWGLKMAPQFYMKFEWKEVEL